ncbi:MAG: sugar kinase [Chloroflexi bacterium]|nr:sugar kinase [Chloroflexota bacterium]
MQIAVVGHAEHVTIAAVPAFPAPGDIVHLDNPAVIAGGGGAIAYFQFARSAADVHFFTAIGIDDAALLVYHEISNVGATIHAALRMEPHTRDLVLVTHDAERTIMVVGRPLHPAIDDRLSWELLGTCDAAYFTGEDPETLKLARNANLLVVTARRSHVLAAAGIRPDIVVGSVRDPREHSRLRDYAEPPRALVLTDGALGGRIETRSGVSSFHAPKIDSPVVGAYGAGDTFAAALTWYLAAGQELEASCERASHHAAAVLTGINPLENQLPLA